MSKAKRLRKTEAVFSILAPEGGYQQRLRRVDQGYDFLDILIKTVEPNATSAWLRVLPIDKREPIIEDETRSGVFLITSAIAIFITEDGGDAIIEKPMVSVYAEINTEVRAREMPAGTLYMYRTP